MERTTLLMLGTPKRTGVKSHNMLVSVATTEPASQRWTKHTEPYEPCEGHAPSPRIAPRKTTCLNLHAA